MVPEYTNLQVVNKSLEENIFHEVIPNATKYPGVIDCQFAAGGFVTSRLYSQARLRPGNFRRESLRGAEPCPARDACHFHWCLLLWTWIPMRLRLPCLRENHREQSVLSREQCCRNHLRGAVQHLERLALGGLRGMRGGGGE